MSAIAEPGHRHRPGRRRLHPGHGLADQRGTGLAPEERRAADACAQHLQDPHRQRRARRYSTARCSTTELSRTASTAARRSASRRCCCPSACSSRSAMRCRPRAGTEPIPRFRRRRRLKPSCARSARCRRPERVRTPAGSLRDGRPAPPRRRLARQRPGRRRRRGRRGARLRAARVRHPHAGRSRRRRRHDRRRPPGIEGDRRGPRHARRARPRASHPPLSARPGARPMLRRRRHPRLQAARRRRARGVAAGRPRFHLQLYGAGHVGRAIARALAPLDASVDWIDEREDEFPVRFHEAAEGPWPAHIRCVCVTPSRARWRARRPLPATSC